MKPSRILFISFTLCIVLVSFGIKKERDENQSLYEDMHGYNKSVAELTKSVASYKEKRDIASNTKYTDSLKDEREKLISERVSLEVWIDSLEKLEERIEKERLKLVRTNWFFAKPQ